MLNAIKIGEKISGKHKETKRPDKNNLGNTIGALRSRVHSLRITHSVVFMRVHAASELLIKELQELTGDKIPSNAASDHLRNDRLLVGS